MTLRKLVEDFCEQINNVLSSYVIKGEIDPQGSLEEEAQRLVKELAIAQQNFDNADPEYIDIAIKELSLAEGRLEALRTKTLLNSRTSKESVENSTLSGDFSS